jgi:hypothetical protein
VNLDRYKDDLDKLIRQGDRLYLALLMDAAPAAAKKAGWTEDKRATLPNVRTEYQAWYSEALTTIRQLLPDRVEDFVGYYKLAKPPQRKEQLNASTYRISDYLQGISVTQGDKQIVGLDAAINPLEQQVQIVKALQQRFQSSLFDIKALVAADLFDNELDAAEELNAKGFHRAGGAIAGVVLEGHLAAACEQHKLSTPKHSTISQLNDLLKKSNVTEVATWRFIQHLGDLRNLCDHKKSEDPTKDQIHELVEGARKITKTVF